MEKILSNKFHKLISIIGSYKKPLLALSGGLDSSFLTFALSKSSREGKTITAVSELFSDSEIARAKRISEQYGIENIVLNIYGKHIPYIKNNPKDRCYLCKKALFTKIDEYREEHGFDILLDGTTYDDLFKHRPGLKAKDQLGVVSPLAEAEISKDDLREIARHYDLEFADLPSFSCLATRFPYGENLTLDKVIAVEKGEQFLKEKGFSQYRVRSHNGIARIEVLPEDFSRLIDIKDEIVSTLKDLGFDYVTIDLEGFRSGSMDLGESKVKN